MMVISSSAVRRYRAPEIEGESVMSADSSFKNHRAETSRTRSGQADARARKLARRKEHDEQLAAEATALGISVDELRTRRAREASSLRTPNRVVSVTPTKVVEPVLRPSSEGYYPWARPGLYDW